MPDMKHDGGKPRWSLLRRGVTRALEGIITVLEFGAKKYAEDSWKTVENGERRYRDALDRHLAEIDKGDEFDAETGLPHIYHVGCNALFLAELYATKKPKRKVTFEPGEWITNTGSQPVSDDVVVEYEMNDGPCKGQILRREADGLVWRIDGHWDIKHWRMPR